MIAQELRIGNLLFDDKGRTVKVLEPSFDLIGCYNGEVNYLYSPASLSGIQLTEEWLLKMGCTYQLSRDFLQSPHPPVYRLTLPDENGRCDFRHQERHFRYIYYVHTLQNLYFALTGQELEIK